MKYLFFIGGSLLCAGPAMAQDQGREARIVVTATRAEAPLAEVGQSVGVITRAEIERSQAVQAIDVLTRLPGVSAASSGGFGQPTSLFVRGADNAQSLVLIDGVRINDPADVGGGFDFGALTIGQFERVELVRGSQSVLWGSRALGGVVHFITAQPGKVWQGRANAEYGWRDRRQVAASASGRLGPVGLSLGGNWLKGDGYSAFSEARGAAEPDGFESTSANLRGELALLSGLSIDAGGFFTAAEYGYDNTGSDAAHRGEKRDVTGFANLRHAGLDGALQARIGIGLTDSHRISRHAVFGPYVTDGRNERFEGQVTWSPTKQVTLVAGAERETSRFRDNFGSQDAARIDGVFGNLTLRPLEGVTLNAGVRRDDHRDFGGRTSQSASGAWALAGVDAPILRASYGEGFKAPSLYQLYTNTGFTALRPETAQAWDIGVEQPFAQGHGRFSLTWFDRKTRNLIDFDFATFTYYNIGRARAKGVELAMQVADWQGFDVNLSYTWLDARNTDTGKRLARRPENGLSASLDYRWNFGLSTGVDLRRGGSRFDDQANSQPVEGHTVLGLRASLPLGDTVELYGRIENLFDRTYEIVRTYGTPGRSAYAGVRARF